MKENTVTISLKKYHSLIDAKKIAKDDMEKELCRKLEEEMKHSIVLESYWTMTTKVLLTNDDALNLAIDKKKGELDGEIAHLKAESTLYFRETKRLESLKWYHLLFGYKPKQIESR